MRFKERVWYFVKNNIWISQKEYCTSTTRINISRDMCVYHTQRICLFFFLESEIHVLNIKLFKLGTKNGFIMAVVPTWFPMNYIYKRIQRTWTKNGHTNWFRWFLKYSVEDTAEWRGPFINHWSSGESAFEKWQTRNITIYLTYTSISFLYCSCYVCNHHRSTFRLN